MNPTVPHCKTIITPVGPWFHLAPLDVEIPKNLKPERFVRFDYGLTFAGRSARGICLSVKKSASQPRIGPYPIFAQAPPDWVVFQAPIPGLLLRSDKPRLAFIGIKVEASGWQQCYEQIAVQRDDLAEIVEVAQPPDRAPLSTEIPVEQLSPEIARLLVQYASQLRVVFINGGPHIHFPTNFRLRQDQWKLLSRHIFTGKSIGCVEETVPLSMRSDDLIKLPGTSLGAVIDRWGIGESKPLAYDGSNHLFRSIHVTNAAKLSGHYPQAKLLSGRVLQAAGNSGSLRSRLGLEPPAVSGWWSFPLLEAAEAGIIPPEGDLTVDSKLKYLFLPKVNITSLQRPLKFTCGHYEPLSLLCPQTLIVTYLLNSAKAVRAYRIPGEVEKYEVQTLDPTTKKLLNLPGMYYQLSDLASLPRRDLRQERADRKARHERLIARYGPDLPADYQRYTDEDLENYYTIKELVARGEIVPTVNHPLLPEINYRQDGFLEWIKEVQPDLVLRCPISGRHYLRPISGMEALADLPGFWPTVERILGQSSWVRSLILNPSVQAAALAHAI